MRVKVKKLTSTAKLPSYANPGDSGADLYADLPGEPLVIPPRSTAVLKTGIAVEIPPGYEGQVRTRSGMAAKMGMMVLNSPGTIDSGYRGEICVIIHNTSYYHRRINHHNRIAQLVITRYSRASFEETVVLSGTVRGAAGLGSTGR